jgi:pimeloyl-ACP methyl ester carboxylesterase
MPPKRRLNDIASALCSAPSSTAAAERLDEQQAEEIQPERDYFRRVAVAPDVALRVVVEGAGPLVVLLHGFPQGWYLWRHTIKPLCDAGFRVAAPDQRGYGLSDAPGDAEQYGLKRLTRDVVELAKGLGHEEFYVVGHDWGCQVAWHVAALYPQSVLGVLGLDVPYTRDPSRGGVAKQLQEDPSRFWYIKEFMENAERFEARALRPAPATRARARSARPLDASDLNTDAGADAGGGGGGPAQMAAQRALGAQRRLTVRHVDGAAELRLGIRAARHNPRAAGRHAIVAIRGGSRLHDGSVRAARAVWTDRVVSKLWGLVRDLRCARPPSSRGSSRGSNRGRGEG